MGFFCWLVRKKNLLIRFFLCFNFRYPFVFFFLCGSDKHSRSFYLYVQLMCGLQSIIEFRREYRSREPLNVVNCSVAEIVIENFICEKSWKFRKNSRKNRKQFPEKFRKNSRKNSDFCSEFS